MHNTDLTLNNLIQNNLTKSVPSNCWGEYFDRFSEDNRGRYMAIVSKSSELGDNRLIQNAPLMAIVYDRPGKGNDLVIEVGKDEVSYAHTIDSPTEVLTGEDSNGLIRLLQISDASGAKTLIQLQANEAS